MEQNFSAIEDAFKEAGLSLSSVEYSITPYSLNSGLSFKFDNLKDLVAFLGLVSPKDNKKIARINVMLVEQRLFPDNFFYVNFYKSKVAEL